MSVFSQDLQAHWTAVRPLLSIQNEQEYGEAVERLNDLIDEIGTNENHPLYEFMDTLGTVLHAYEEEQEAMPDCHGKDTLQYLMEEHGLSVADLPELGAACEISELLTGDKEFSLRQIRLLATRFKVSPAVFL